MKKLTVLLLLACMGCAVRRTHAQTSAYIAVGNPNAYTDSTSQVWAADNGSNCTGGSTFFYNVGIAGTPDPTLYRYGRVGSNLSCSVAMSVGVYSVRLKFADVNPAITAPGQQVFNIFVNGTLQVANFDIFGIVRNQNTAYDVVLPLFANLNSSVTININQVSTGSQGAQLQALSITTFYLPGATASVGAWQAMSLVNGYANAVTYNTSRYRLEIDGMTVRLSGGLVSSGGGAQFTTLPLGYRPAANVLIVAYCTTGVNFVGVSSAGAVSFGAAPNGATCSLDGITFPIN